MAETCIKCNKKISMWKAFYDGNKVYCEKCWAEKQNLRKEKSETKEKLDIKNLNWFQKIIFFLGWINVLNPVFWVIIIVVANYFNEDKFWSESTLKVVYIFGWITFISLIIVFILGLFGLL